MQGVFRREERLTRALEALKYDYCLVDCAPSLGVSTINAFCAATAVLICIQTNKWALQAIRRLVKHIDDVRDEANPSLILWALPTLHRSGTNLHRDVLAKIDEVFGEQTLPPIRHTVAFAEAAAAGQSIVEYANGSRGHQDYRVIAEEVIRRVEGREQAEAIG
jgi:chromosome partitioning protein